MADTGDVSKLRVALSKISGYTKSAAGKQLPVVVRISQNTKKASWKPDKAPNWWVAGYVVDESNIEGEVPAFGPVKNMKVDGIKAALGAFYLARIHFEEHVRNAADAAILEESTDGKNPFMPEHYAGPEEVDDDDEVVAEEEMEDEQPESEEDDVAVEAEEEDNGDDDGGDAEEDEVYNVKELKRLVASMKRNNSCAEMFGVLREKLLSVVAEEKRRDEWTVHDEEYKLTLGYHTCCAKLLVDVEALKREEDMRFEAYTAELRAQCEKDLSRLPKSILSTPVRDVRQKQLDDVLARLDARAALTVPPEDTSDNSVARRPRTRASSVIDVDNDNGVEAGFTTPVVDAQKQRRAAAASRSIKKGTPLRQLKESEIDFDTDGNVISLFTASGSPVYVDASIFHKAVRPRRANRAVQGAGASTASKPPPTPATAARRSRRNKR